MTRGGAPSAATAGEGAAGVHVALVVARFNGDVTGRLAAGARACLEERGAAPGTVDEYGVPGAWELPQAVARVVAAGRHDAIVALGCVIRGETPHFEYVSAEATRGLGAVARSSDVPVAFGVLTTDDRDQALARSEPGRGNKGYEAASAVLEMVALYRSLEAD